MFRTIALTLLVMTVGASAAGAQGLPLPLPIPPFLDTQGTPEERRACQNDVHKYCEAALGSGDVMRVGNCLQANRQRISRACQQVLANRGM